MNLKAMKNNDKLLLIMKRLFLIVFIVVFQCNVYSQNNAFWGVLETGGEYYSGSVYSINEKGDNFKVKHSFKTVVGEWPRGVLCKKNENTYYGIASGGLYRGGLIFQFDPLSKNYKVLFNFSNNDGWSPEGGLLLLDNKLYGVTYEGGTNRKGIIYCFDLYTNTLKVLHNFDGINQYSNIGAKTQLVVLNNTLYGLTKNGGEYDKGTLYSYNLEKNIYKKCIDFDGKIGAYPLAPLTITKSGKIIGSTSQGLSNKDGKLFEFEPEKNILSPILSFDKVEGSFVQSQIISLNDSTLIGVTTYGGKNDSGVIFEYDLKKSNYKVLFNLSEKETGKESKGVLSLSDNGEVLGLLSKGGLYNCGTAFSYSDVKKEFKVLMHFDTQKGYEFNNGFIFQDQSSVIGVATEGGQFTRYGNIFTINLKDQSYTQLLNFQNSADGRKPIGNLLYWKGYVYGITNEGGKSDAGTIYRISVKDNKFEKVIDLHDYHISNPSDGLSLDFDGKMYGFAGSSDPKSLPKVFYYNPENNKIVVLLKFRNDALPDKSMSQDDSKILENRNNNQVVVKITEKPKYIDLNKEKLEADAVIIIGRKEDSKYLFEKPIGAPVIVGEDLYGLFDINDTPKNGGIFNFNLKSKKIRVLEYFGHGVSGNLIYNKGNLLYANSEGKIDSTSVISNNYFDDKRKGPEGYINGYGKKVFYNFPMHSDLLCKNVLQDGIAKGVICFGVPDVVNFNELKNETSGKPYDLAAIYVKNNKNRFVKAETFNVKTTGSVLVGPLSYHSNDFYGVTSFGGEFGSGVFFRYKPKENVFEKLFDFPIKEDTYPTNPSSLLWVKN
jgi:uncharacterized repeat protein (TIGR03803 family)